MTLYVPADVTILLQLALALITYYNTVIIIQYNRHTGSLRKWLNILFISLISCSYIIGNTRVSIMNFTPITHIIEFTHQIYIISKTALAVQQDYNNYTTHACSIANVS